MFIYLNSLITIFILLISMIYYLLFIYCLWNFIIYLFYCYSLIYCIVINKNYSNFIRERIVFKFSEFRANQISYILLKDILFL